MAVTSVSPNNLSEFDRSRTVALYPDVRPLQPPSRGNEYPVLCTLDVPFANELLAKSARMICQKYKIAFSQLSGIQRKFVTHYRCDNCGMLPLYHINLTHARRVRCRKCGELIAFTTHGKYGKLRKEVAFELAKVVMGDRRHVE